MVTTPTLTLRTDQVVVFDNFLPNASFKDIFNYVSLDDYNLVHTHGQFKKVWRLNDGFPLRGGTIFYKANTSKEAEKQKYNYPTGTIVDLLLEQMLAVLPEVDTIVGKEAEAWQSFSLTPWIYQMGTALSLHQDAAGIYSGSYTYYLHPEWNIHWGGHLLVVDPKTEISRQFVKLPGDNKSRYQDPWLNDQTENSQVQDPGFALTIFPKPNRMVFIAPQAFHMISRVDQNAGQNPRISLGGFFHIKHA